MPGFLALLGAAGCATLFPHPPMLEPPSDALGCWSVDFDPAIRVLEDSLEYPIPNRLHLVDLPTTAEGRWHAYPTAHDVKITWVAHDAWGPAWRQLRQLKWNENPRAAPTGYRNPGDTIQIHLPGPVFTVTWRVAGSSERMSGRGTRWLDLELNDDFERNGVERRDYRVEMTRMSCEGFDRTLR